MNTLVANVVLAIIWALFFGGFGWLTVTSGLVVGYVILWLLQPLQGALRVTSSVSGIGRN